MRKYKNKKRDEETYIICKRKDCEIPIIMTHWSINAEAIGSKKEIGHFHNKKVFNDYGKR